MSYRLEEIKNVMDDAKKFNKIRDYEQEDNAKCYLVEEHGDWLIEQAERNVTAQETVEILGESLKQSIEQNKHYRDLLESISTTNKVASEIFNKKDGKTLIGPDDILQHILRKVNEELESESE